MVVLNRYPLRRFVTLPLLAETITLLLSLAAGASSHLAESQGCSRSCNVATQVSWLLSDSLISLSSVYLLLLPSLNSGLGICYAFTCTLVFRDGTDSSPSKEGKQVSEEKLCADPVPWPHAQWRGAADQAARGFGSPLGEGKVKHRERWQTKL